MRRHTQRSAVLRSVLVALAIAPAVSMSQAVPEPSPPPTMPPPAVPDSAKKFRDLRIVLPDSVAATPATVPMPRRDPSLEQFLRSHRDSLPLSPATIANCCAESAIRLISPYQLERARLSELTAGVSDIPMMLRSVSSMLERLTPGEKRFGFLHSELQFVNNTNLPWSMNDGDLWAGRGLNSILGAGFVVIVPHWEIVLAPQVSTEQNKYFALHIPEIERFPIPLDKSQWAFPWYVNGPYSIDMPTRFGSKRLRRLSPGQSTVAVRAANVRVGFSNENEWWGPGIGNALVLSNNAPGFPHFFLRTAKPVPTRLGRVDFRWLAGGLSESAFFDTTSTNNLRSLSAVAATIQTGWDPNLVLGLARSVFRTADNWGQVSVRWLDIFSNTGHPNNRPLSDSSLYPGGRDQVYSLFGRWVFPKSGFEIYGEWGRTEFPTSLRDFLVAPNHSQAYTVGLQWRRTGFTADDFWHIQAENTSVEQSPTFRDRPLGVWYTSRVVTQGYTNRGQPLGAAVGPGSSGQNLNIDYMRPNWSIGLKTGRVRLNEDVRSISPIFEFKSWCTHDIDLYYGGRVTSQSRFGFASFDFTAGNRIQPWFQVRSGCPRGDAMVDIRNNTISVTFIPFLKP